MPFTPESTRVARMELANRLFFRLYQCANLLHKTGSRAVESEGLTTQQWAVLGALSRPEAEGGISVGDPARYIGVAPDERDRRSRLIRMTPHGSKVWLEQAQPKIQAYYEQALNEFSMGDITHTLHYLLQLLENMKQLDNGPDDEVTGL